MTNSQEIKQKLGETTEQLESKVKELTPYYTNLEPWQRGVLILILTSLLLLSIYYLTKSEPNLNLSTRKESQREKEIEERLMRQMAFFKRLKE